MRAWQALLAISCLVFPTAGQEPTTPDTPKQAADKVLAAVAAGDDSALKALAARDDPDPWLAADELCFAGQFDAAYAFAKVCPRADIERLPEYVAGQRKSPTAPALRKALAEANEALERNDGGGALAAIEGVKAEGLNVASIRLDYGRGLALRAVDRLEESAEAFRRAAEASERVGWLAHAAICQRKSGESAYSRADWRTALAAWTSGASIEERRANRAGLGASLGNIGMLHWRIGDYPKALDFQGQALALLQEVGDRAGIASVLGNIGATYQGLGDFRKALDFQERSLRLETELGNRAGVAASLVNIGCIHDALGDYPRALDCLERGLREAEAIGHRQWAANAVVNIGTLQMQLGDHAKALESFDRALGLMEALGDRAGVATTLGNIGNIHLDLGDYAKALDFQERSLRLREELGDRAGVAASLGNVGIIHACLGDYAKALDFGERSLRLLEQLGDRAGMALALGNIGRAHELLGDYPKALHFFEQALGRMEEVGDRAGVAASLGNIGVIYQRLGDYPKALDIQERSLRLREELGDRGGVALTLGNICAIYGTLEDYPRARDFQERALRLYEQLGSRAGVANALANLGNIHHNLGDCEKALDFQERSLRLDEEIGDRAGVASTLGNIGNLHRDLGDYAKALDYQERGLALAEVLGATDTAVHCLWGAAATHLAVGRPREALAAARNAVEMMNGLMRGVGEEQGATVRGVYSGVFDVGATAALRLSDAAEGCFFLESGRAGALLEALGVRDAVAAGAMPEALRDSERVARAREAAAGNALRTAVAGGNLAAVAKARSEYDKARREVLDAVERIQREAKAVANLAYPKADPLATIRGRLRQGEALVLYGLTRTDALALVVTSEHARLAALPAPDDIGMACAALTAGEDVDPAAAADALRRLVVEPLKLEGKTTRVLVSPDGPLSYVPFVLLMPDKEVCYVPSGTAYGVLLDDAAKRGEGVLALGDPDYGAKSELDSVATAMRGGTGLARLPKAGLEAKAVGDRVITGRDACEQGLRDALSRRPRWRAVHLACHGILDTERPMFSALALTPSGEDDGFLTVLDVFRMKVPADLAVLSACETAKGKVYRAEGIAGLTRAFMFAGAPRVIVSLWRVDDDATMALMVKFYEIWNPKGGSRGLPTGTALRKAMEFVRDHPDHPEWKHPRYWAAWQLWGLPD